MAKAFEVRVSGRNLILGLLLTVVPVSLLALYASTTAGRNAERAAGRQLQTVAESVAAQVRERLRAKVVEAALMASNAAVLDIVQRANERFQRKPLEEVRADLETQDKRWDTPEGQDLVEQALSNPAAQALRRQLTVDPSFLRVTVTDAEGGTVAATHKTLDYYQADEEYWQDIYAFGRGAVSLTDILYDEATKSFYIGVGLPVVNENNKFIGTLDALVDVSAMFPLVRRADVAEGTVAIVKRDASIIASSDEASLADDAHSPEFSAINDAGSRFEGHGSGYMQASFPQRERKLIAFADTGLKDEFRSLDWAVVVSQPASEAFGTSGMQLVIMGIALLSLALVVFFAVYFMLHRQSEIEEIEEEMSSPVRAMSR